RPNQSRSLLHELRAFALVRLPIFLAHGEHYFSQPAVHSRSRGWTALLSTQLSFHPACLGRRAGLARVSPIVRPPADWPRRASLGRRSLRPAAPTPLLRPCVRGFNPGHPVSGHTLLDPRFPISINLGVPMAGRRPSSLAGLR